MIDCKKTHSKLAKYLSVIQRKPVRRILNVKKECVNVLTVKKIIENYRKYKVIRKIDHLKSK